MAKTRKGRVWVSDNGRNIYNNRAKLDSRDEVANGEINGNDIRENKVIEKKNRQKHPNPKKH